MLEGISVVTLTPPVLLGITVLLLLMGKIVPRVALQDKVKDAEIWRQAYEAERQARNTSDRQTAELLELAQTTHTIISAMFETQKGGRDVDIPT